MDLVVWMVSVAVLTFGATEVGRAIAVAYYAPLVQVHRDFTLSSPVIAILLLTILVVTFVLVRPQLPLIAVALGFYAGGTLANAAELTLHGGVADYVPLFGYVFSLGDVDAALGCVLVFLALTRRAVKRWNTSAKNPGS